MGNQSTTTNCIRKKKKDDEDKPHVPERERSMPTLSAFYQACRNGDIDQVQQSLPTMSLDEINRIESNGSTALHAACYYGRLDIVRLLLDAGACRSIRNRRYSLTPFDEANESIRQLFYRVNTMKDSTVDVAIDRFTGLSVNNEWMMETKQAAEWKVNLYQWLKIERSFEEMIAFLQQRYLTEFVLPVCQMKRDKNMIQWFFQQAMNENDVRYIVKAYTSPTQFFTVVNNHLRQFLLRFFRHDCHERHPNILEKSAGYLASIFIYHPQLRSLSYTGLTYRGMVMSQRDLEVYTVGKRLLNKSLLSTSSERRVAEVFAGAGDSNYMRRNINHDLIQYITFCTYKIRNKNTALVIGDMSEIPSEKEVLIMPLCAFQVKSIKQHLAENSLIHVEIKLEECDMNPSI